MSRGKPQTLDARDALTRQIPSFLIIGALGFCLDASLTVMLARNFAVPPLLARPPAFVVVTIVNFLLNRTFTFRSSEAPLWRAFARYVLVCLAGLSVNYVVYAALLGLARLAGIAATPAALTLCVAGGTLAATLLTFTGFRAFAFRG